MKGWILYNGSLETEKIKKLVKDLYHDAKQEGLDIELVQNSEVIPYFNPSGEAKLTTIHNYEFPEYVIFWDKDITLARHLEMMNIRLFNSKAAIENCDNKAWMHQELSKRNIRVPKTIIGPFAYRKQNLTETYINTVFDLLGENVIIKEVKGSFGMQVYKINNRQEFCHKIQEIGNASFIIQEDVRSSHGRDIRVNIIGDQIIGAMIRESDTDFRANITLGGRGTYIDLTQEQKQIALEAHKALGLDFSGVDLLFDEEDRPIVCEVNSNVNYLSFERVSSIAYGKELVRYIKEQLQ